VCHPKEDNKNIVNQKSTILGASFLKDRFKSPNRPRRKSALSITTTTTNNDDKRELQCDRYPILVFLLNELYYILPRMSGDVCVI
jgi:hypothetical protein